MSSYELSPLNQYIREFNHQKLSNNEISKALWDRYEIKLSKSSVGRRLMELRQDPNNKIKLNNVCSINVNRPKSELKWYKIMERVPKEISQYVTLFGFKPTSRTMAYQFQDLHLIGPKDVKAFVEATVKARLEFTDGSGQLLFPKLDIDCFADESRRSIGRFANDWPKEPTAPTPDKDPDDFIADAINDLKQSIRYYDGISMHGTGGEPGGYWYGQEEYVEIWQEKNDLLDGFYTLMEDRHIEVKANRGYSSLVWLYKCCESLKEIIALGYEPKHIHVGYFGDWDPSGYDQFEYIKKRLNQLKLFGVDLQWVGVTKEQLKKYKLPLMSLAAKPGKKDNPNKREFIRRFGPEATHLNAFFTKKHIKEFQNDVLLPWIDQFHDKKVYDEMIEEYDVAPLEPDPPIGYSGEKLRQVHQKMQETVTNAFRPGWDLGAPEDKYEEEEDDTE